MLLRSFIGLANDWFIPRFGIETLVIINIINVLVGFVVTFFLFAATLKILPDVEIKWKSVRNGAIATALILPLGKYILTFYFNTFNPSYSFGTAGTIILLLLWINYTCQLIFVVAEFTEVYTKSRGYEPKPSKHAKWSPQLVQAEDAKEVTADAEPVSNTTKDAY